VTPEHRYRWELEIRNQRGPLKKPADLLRRAVSPEDFVDSAVIGGFTVADILAGKVHEWQIPHNVIDAFHSQYPQYGESFVQAVHNQASDPSSLMGLINGVKGKLFELDYANWLNHGNLPHGFTAELAHHANNPGWDVVIRDAHGHVDQFLQMKATDSISYVHEAIAAHPDIPVVLPHELYEKMLDHHDALAHILDGHESLTHLTDRVGDAADHATSSVADHFPIFGPALVVGLAAALNYERYRKGRITISDALHNVGDRGLLAVLAMGAGWIANLAVGKPFVTLPTSIIVRLFGGQVLHNRKRRQLLSNLVSVAQDSRIQLERQLPRPLLESAKTSLT
jgi:hypothetical protein